MTCWQDPFEVARQARLVNYEIRLPGRRKEIRIYHVSLIKPWKTWEALLMTPFPVRPELGPQVHICQGLIPVVEGVGLLPGQRA